MSYRPNLTMLTDFYEFTMANGFFKEGFSEKIAYFDMFYRSIPDQGGFAIMAGVEQLIDYLNHLEFTDEDIAYLKEKGIFDDGFLEYLKNFRFCCDVWAIPEGTPIFPGEPIVTVRGPVVQAQLVETMLLSLMYEGRFHSFLPKTYLDRMDLTVIRPLIYVSESEVIGFRNKYHLPVAKSPCPADGYTKRQYVKDLLRKLNQENPGVKNRMFSAIVNGYLEDWPES